MRPSRSSKKTLDDVRAGESTRHGRQRISAQSGMLLKDMLLLEMALLVLLCTSIYLSILLIEDAYAMRIAGVKRTLQLSEVVPDADGLVRQGRDNKVLFGVERFGRHDIV